MTFIPQSLTLKSPLPLPLSSNKYSDSAAPPVATMRSKSQESCRSSKLGTCLESDAPRINVCPVSISMPLHRCVFIFPQLKLSANPAMFIHLSISRLLMGNGVESFMRWDFSQWNWTMIDPSGDFRNGFSAIFPLSNHQYGFRNKNYTWCCYYFLNSIHQSMCYSPCAVDQRGMCVSCWRTSYIR